jgi:hypothetical protein
MSRKHNAITKRLITRNPNKRLRQWKPPAPGWNARRCILETGADGAWFTRPLVARKWGCSMSALGYAFRELEKAGAIERKRIEGRAGTEWRHVPEEPSARNPRHMVRRPKAVWAFRLTHAGLDALERLRAGERDIIGRARSAYYATLQGWMPGRGPIRRRIVLQRLGRPSWDVLTWCWGNYGNPRPLGGGLWVWQEWDVETLFS